MTRHIVIVGGGTAGWLAALILGDAKSRMPGLPLQKVTVIESSKIGTVGVGEGTTAVFRQMLKYFGMDEAAFLAETGATIKYGIRHRDWRRLGHHYDGPIDDVQAVAGHGLDLYAVASGRPVSEVHLFQHLMNRGRAPVATVKGRAVPAGPYHHAFHFDQALAGAFFKRRTKGVELIDDQVQCVIRDGVSGDITALKMESGREIEGDFFLDCSGFRRILMSELSAEWVGYGDTLPVNRAMPFWVDLKPGEEIDPFTLSWAQKSGWLWKIPTQDRYGCGYVYSDEHISPDQAQAEIEVALGHAIEPRNDIRINAGRLDRSWVANCVAIGLSSSFLEPLEATSIHGTIVQLLWLKRWMNEVHGRDTYNAAVARQVDEFRDFIRMHYVSERRDSPFWQEVAETHSAEVRDRLYLWSTKLPTRSDFVPFPGDLPHVQEQLYTPVLDGLGLLNTKAAKDVLARDPKRRAQLRKTYDQIIKEYKRAAGKCLPHRTWLNSLQQDNAT
jgi:glycine/D-amino acid oxidase-like deaminating enzyme